MIKILKATTAFMSVVLVFCLMGCASDNKVLSAQNATDEMLACDFQEFSDSMGGKLLSDWRKLGGDGIEVATVESGADVLYYFTREASSNDYLDRLEFVKTITVNLSSDTNLDVEISEIYDSESKRIGSRKTSYSVARRTSDESFDSFSHIGEEDAIKLMKEHGCLELVEQLSTSPIEFFVNAYLEYNLNTTYSDDNWGFYG